VRKESLPSFSRRKKRERSYFLILLVTSVVTRSLRSLVTLVESLLNRPPPYILGRLNFFNLGLSSYDKASRSLQSLIQMVKRCPGLLMLYQLPFDAKRTGSVYVIWGTILTEYSKTVSLSSFTLHLYSRSLASFWPFM
jgi:hypothetical protein